MSDSKEQMRHQRLAPSRAARAKRGTRAAILVLITTGLMACEGKISLNPNADGVGTVADINDIDPTNDPDNPSVEDPPPGTIERPPGDTPVDEEPACQFIDPGSTPLRRLTTTEYINSVRDVFDLPELLDRNMTPDERIAGFPANTVASVTELQAEEYQLAAEEIAVLVVNNLGNLLDGADEQGVRFFIETYGKRAFRRPLAQEEVDGLYTLYDLGAQDFDGETGAQMVVEAMLQSPSFLYRSEFGVPSEDEVVRLTDYEVAARLSYFLWGTTPDDTLLTAADNGGLSTAEDVEAHARRMLEDPRARTRINEVFTQWLRIDELDGVDNPDPAFTPEVRQAMIDETEAFIDHVLWESNGTLTELLTADYSFVNAYTGALYGVQGVPVGSLERVDLPPGRLGILSHAGVLTMHGHGQAPVHRGKFIRDAFLCLSDPAPQPPNEIVPLETFEGESMRSKAEKRMAARDEGCAGCHGMMDGLGLAFDTFDSLGRYQTMDEFGNALTAEAEILYTKTSDGTVEGVAELANHLAASPEVSECVTVQFFRYAFARLNGTSDACSLYVVNQALADSGNDLKEMIIALATTDAFLYRRNPSM